MFEKKQKKRNQSSRQDRDRSTSEDFDLEKLGRCAKEEASLAKANSNSLCWTILVCKLELALAEWKFVDARATVKGQLISKGLFGILNFSKKRTKKFDFITYYDTSGRLVFVHFLEELEDIQKTLRK